MSVKIIVWEKYLDSIKNIHICIYIIFTTKEIIMLKEMLSLLEKNARIEVTDLAALLNTDEKTVNDQIKKCEDNNVIAGYHTIINWDNTNTEVVKAMIAVSGTPERDTGYDHIAEIIASYPEVDSLYLVSGKTEFILIINGSTMREIADFVLID